MSALAASSASAAPWSALEGALERAEAEAAARATRRQQAEGGWRAEAEAARTAEVVRCTAARERDEARRAAQKASTSLQAEAARRSRLHAALAEEQETSGALRLELHGERELRLRLQAELGGEVRGEARDGARGEARSCGARGASGVSAHNAAAMLECAQRVAAESDAREAYHVERRQEARCPTTVPTYCTYPVHEQARTTYQPTYLPNTPSADLIT